MGTCLTSPSTQSAKRHSEAKQSDISPKIALKKAGLQVDPPLALSSQYSIHSKVLGHGTFGKVFKAHSLADASHEVAIKLIDKKAANIQLQQIKDEIKILQALDHPNIVKYYETYETNKYIYIVMEYCSGGQLFEKITQKGVDTFNESEAAQIMEELLMAVNHCHALNVAHRDLKPENIMYSSNSDKHEIKLIDFGLAIKAKNATPKLSTKVGTPYYVAPEILDGHYGLECDMWSLGVIMYILLSGCFPFCGEDDAQIFMKIRAGRVSFHQKEWSKVSDEGKDLVRHMLDSNKKTRLTATQALKHPWFSYNKNMEKGSEQDKLDSTIINSLKVYKGSSRLRIETLNILVKMMDESELEHLRKQFKKIDEDKTGLITPAELEQAIRKVGASITANEVKNIIETVDHHHNGKINYSEFLAATISVKTYLTKEKLLALYKRYDADDKGYITRKDIKEAMHHWGKKISKKELNEIMAMHDLEKHGTIGFEEFKIMMLGISDANPEEHQA